MTVQADGTPAPTERMRQEHIEIIVSVLGTAASTGNGFESRTSYTIDSIRFGHRFADALHRRADGEGTLVVDISKLSETIPEDPAKLLLPQCFG